MIELKNRLRSIAGFVPQDSVVIDVGTDHAYLPIFLVQQGICPKAVGVDVHKGPYQSAVDQVLHQGLANKIAIFWGDGLKPLQPGAGDVVVIAGMGGNTIRDILAASPEVLEGVKRLVLQPMVASALLRRWLIDHGWAIIAEQLVKDEARIYEIVVVEPGGMAMPSELELELGPYIIKDKDQLLSELVAAKIAALQTVLGQLVNTSRPEVLEKRQELESKIAELREVLG